MQLFQGHWIKFVAVHADPRTHEHCALLHEFIYFLPFNGVFDLYFHAFSHVNYCEGMGANKHATSTRTEDDACCNTG